MIDFDPKKFCFDLTQLKMCAKTVFFELETKQSLPIL